MTQLQRLQDILENVQKAREFIKSYCSPRIQHDLGWQITRLRYAERDLREAIAEEEKKTMDDTRVFAGAIETTATWHPKESPMQEPKAKPESVRKVCPLFRIRMTQEREEIARVFLGSARAIRDVLKEIKPMALNGKSVSGSAGPLEEMIYQAVQWAVLQYRRCELKEPLAPARWTAYREEIKQLLAEEK